MLAGSLARVEYAISLHPAQTATYTGRISGRKFQKKHAVSIFSARQKLTGQPLGWPVTKTLGFCSQNSGHTGTRTCWSSVASPLFRTVAIAPVRDCKERGNGGL